MKNHFLVLILNLGCMQLLVMCSKDMEINSIRPSKYDVPYSAWGPWTSWSSCPIPDGDNVTRTRTLTNGAATQTETKTCPPCTPEPWSFWTKCECSGIQTRFRVCLSEGSTVTEGQTRVCHPPPECFTGKAMETCSYLRHVTIFIIHPCDPTVVICYLI